MTKTRVLKSSSRNRNRNILISMAVIAACIAGVYVAIEQNDQRQEFLVAKVGLSAGAKLTAESVTKISVNLADAKASYLRAVPTDPAAFLIASVRKGELIPLAQLAHNAADTRVPVQVTPTMGISKAVKVGSAIDLWASSSSGGQTWAPPRILSIGAEVADIVEPSGMFADSLPALDLMVHPDDLAAVIYAVASGDKFAAILKPTLLDQ